jgi:dinuclear metal center YbgI/SA1388 family protein
MAPLVPLHDIVAYLDELLQVERYREEEPSNGLLVDVGQPVMRIAAAVSTSFTAIRGAAEVGAELLLVHHTTWAHIDLHLKGEKEEALRRAGVSLYGAHAALDCAPELGNPDSLARLAGVRVEGRFLEWAGGQPGVYGRADGTFTEFVERVRAALGVPVQSWQNSGAFGRVAIVTGAGGGTPMLDGARSLGCDTYLTGEGTMDTKLFAREIGMNLVFGTHYATEAPGIKSLAERVAGHFGLPWSFVDEGPDIL